MRATFLLYLWIIVLSIIPSISDVTIFHALMRVDHHSFFYLRAFFYPYFIPPFDLTSSDFIIFSSCSMFDMGSTSTLYSCLLDVTIHLSPFFVWGPLDSGLMTFSMHCISCTRGMRIISLGSLSLVSFHFFHPITLAYITSCVWRPPWGHYFTSCLTAPTWAILKLGRRLFLRAWWMGGWDDDLHWVIPFLSVMDFQRRHYLHWGIPRSSMTVS